MTDMFNEFGVINPKEMETLKYIDEFNQQVKKQLNQVIKVQF